MQAAVALVDRLAVVAPRFDAVTAVGRPRAGPCPGRYLPCLCYPFYEKGISLRVLLLVLLVLRYCGTAVLRSQRACDVLPLRSVFDVAHLRVRDAERVDQLLVLVVVGLLLLAFRAAAAVCCGSTGGHWRRTGSTTRRSCSRTAVHRTARRSTAYRCGPARRPGQRRYSRPSPWRSNGLACAVLSISSVVSREASVSWVGWAARCRRVPWQSICMPVSSRVRGGMVRNGSRRCGRRRCRVSGSRGRRCSRLRAAAGSKHQGQYGATGDRRMRGSLGKSHDRPQAVAQGQIDSSSRLTSCQHGFWAKV